MAFPSPTAVQDQPLWKHGERVQQGGRDAFPIMPENEGIGTDIGRAVGSTAPLLGLGHLGLVGRAVAGAGITLQSLGSAAQQAASGGADDETIRRVALEAGGPNAVLNFVGLNHLLAQKYVNAPGLVPWLAAFGVNLAKEANYQGAVAGIMQMVDNAVAQWEYDPERALMDG